MFSLDFLVPYPNIFFFTSPLASFQALKLQFDQSPLKQAALFSKRYEQIFPNYQYLRPTGGSGGWAELHKSSAKANVCSLTAVRTINSARPRETF